MGDSLSITKSTARNRRTLFLGQLASAHTRLGRAAVALGLLEEAIQTAETTNERFFEAELHRLQGTVLLELGRRDEADARRVLLRITSKGARLLHKLTAHHRSELEVMGPALIEALTRIERFEQDHTLSAQSGTRAAMRGAR